MFQNLHFQSHSFSNHSWARIFEQVMKRIPEAVLGLLQHPRWSALWSQSTPSWMLQQPKALHLGCCNSPRSASEYHFSLRLLVYALHSAECVKLVSKEAIRGVLLKNHQETPTPGVFLWILWSFLEHLFWRTSANICKINSWNGVISQSFTIFIFA